MNFQKERYYDVDAIKCFGIFAVVWYHIYYGYYINIWCDSFQIPLFFFATGLIFREYSVKEFFKKRTDNLLVHYFIFGALSLIYYFSIEHTHRNLTFSLPEAVIKGLLGGEFHYLEFNTPLWFIPCFFVTNTIVFFMYKGLNKSRIFSNNSNRKVYIALIILCVFLPIAISCLRVGENVYAPYSIHKVPKYAIWMVIGILCTTIDIRRLNEKLGQKNCLLMGLLLLAISFGACIWKYTLTASILAVAGFYEVSYYAQKNKWIVYIGQRTLIIMVTHGPIYRVLVYVAATMASKTTEGIRENVFICIIIAVITLVICLVIEKYYKLIIRNIKNTLIREKN